MQIGQRLPAMGGLLQSIRSMLSSFSRIFCELYYPDQQCSFTWRLWHLSGADYVGDLYSHQRCLFNTGVAIAAVAIFFVVEFIRIENQQPLPEICSSL
ncbi:MAG: hypothetical protein IPP73_17390 [Chitinophagaceae bacterium]|nr:hypothetical protein [Chitinophagaceae bacterium]